MSNWQRIVERCWRDARVVQEEALAGDASTRRYVRLRLAGEGAPHSVVAMLLPAPEPSAEADTAAARRSAHDFVDVREHLAARGVPVPEIHLDAADDEGVLLLEDLGDVPLAEAALRDEAGSALLGEAADVAARIAAAIRSPDPACVAFTRRHQASTERELHLIGAFAVADDGRRRDFEGDRELAAALGRLGEALAAQPEVLMHRDYHAWNLHVDGRGRVRVIDFQDAMVGPAAYDLATLCTDRSSARFVDAEREAALLDRFVHALRENGLDLYRDAASLRRDYLVAVAFRALRVLGRFRQLAIEAHRPAHLRFVPDVARQARRALAELDDGSLLRLLAARSALFA